MGLGRSLRTAWLQGWHLFLMLQTRQYRATFLGYVWLLAEPIAMATPVLLVGRALRLADAGRTGLPYSIYGFSGVMLWQVYATTSSRVPGVFHRVRKTARRLHVDPLAPLVCVLLELTISVTFSFTIFLLLAVTIGFPLSTRMLLFPLPALVMFATGAVVGLPFALADWIYRDARRVLGLLNQLLFWTLPIVHLPPKGTTLQAVVAWHPLTPYFDLWRHLVAGRIDVDLMPLVGSTIAILVAFVLVARFFRARFWGALDYVV